MIVDEKRRQRLALRYADLWVRLPRRLDRARAEQYDAAWLPVVKEARRNGVPHERLKRDCRTLGEHTYSLAAFREELERMRRRWLAKSVEGSPLDLYFEERHT